MSDIWQALRAQIAVGDFVWVETQERATIEGSAANWPQRQWWHAFCKLFGTEEAAESADDMLFCVLQARPLGAAPYVALRRPLRGLPESLAYGGRMYHVTDWQESVQLNAVMHATFRLTLAVRRAVVESVNGKGAESTPPQGEPFVVRRRVWPRLTRTALQADCSMRRDAAAQSTWPDVCFALDDFDVGVAACHLRQPGDRFVVVLEVHQQLSGAPQGSANRGRDADGAAACCSERVQATGCPDSTLSEAEPARPSAGHSGGSDSPPGQAPTAIQQSSADCAPRSEEEAPPDAGITAYDSEEASAECACAVQKRTALFTVDASAEETEGQWLPVSKCRVPLCLDGAAASGPEALASAQQAEPASPAAMGTSQTWLPVFQGFVQYEQVLRSQRRRVRPGMAPSGPHLVGMRGPGGHGRAEVALTIRCPAAPTQAVMQPPLTRLAASLSKTLLPGAWEGDCKSAQPVFACSLISLQVAVADAMRCLLDLPVGVV